MRLAVTLLSLCPLAAWGSENETPESRNETPPPRYELRVAASADGSRELDGTLRVQRGRGTFALGIDSVARGPERFAAHVAAALEVEPCSFEAQLRVRPEQAGVSGAWAQVGASSEAWSLVLGARRVAVGTQLQLDALSAEAEAGATFRVRGSVGLAELRAIHVPTADRAASLLGLTAQEWPHLASLAAGAQQSFGAFQARAWLGAAWPLSGALAPEGTVELAHETEHSRLALEATVASWGAQVAFSGSWAP